MTSSRLLAVALTLLAASCTAGSDDGAQAKSDAAVDGSEVSEESQVIAGSDDAPELIPGGVARGSVEISGTMIDYVVSVPVGFVDGDEAPLLLAFPPGGGDLDLTEGLVTSTYAPEAQRLGWVVVGPAAPDGLLYFEGSEALVPGFLDWIETWVVPVGGTPHIAGVSNGGISAFRYAALNPDRLQSITVFPGFPRSEADQAALADLAGLPIRMFVGGTDTGWIGPAEETVETMEALGGDIELTVFEGEGHVIGSVRDGVMIFEQLESFR